jgi:hypothetical protein
MAQTSHICQLETNDESASHRLVSPRLASALASTLLIHRISFLILAVRSLVLSLDESHSVVGEEDASPFR